jgi:hypothetical protein
MRILLNDREVGVEAIARIMRNLAYKPKIDIRARTPMILILSLIGVREIKSIA